MLDVAVLEDIKNENVFKSLLKANAIVPRFQKILVSISGGSDSDIVLDIIEKVKSNEQIVDYVFFDTGLEYQATKKHLDYLEKRYGISIQRLCGKKSIPITCREFGQPFLSKYVSEQISSLQKNNFKFEDKSFDELLKEYPKCQSRLKWWCNEYKPSWLSIRNFKYLKEFLIENPPQFKISPACCKYAKKDPIKNKLLIGNYDLNVLGIRKSEGGIRRNIYKSCFNDSERIGIPKFLPVFWLTDSDKKYYNDYFDIVNSDCYTKYGLTRTGCVGCPFGRKNKAELNTIKNYEPNLFKACSTVFKDAYRYTIQFEDFKIKRKIK